MPIPKGCRQFPTTRAVVHAAGMRLGIDFGTTRTVVSAGTHLVEFASDRAGFRATQTVTVEPGQVSTVQVAVPNGSLSVRAEPPAEVFVDGQPAGTTPIEALPLSVGVRTIVLRHPRAGERSYEVVIREGRLTALSVNLEPR